MESSRPSVLPNLDGSDDADGLNYICTLSTILVAAIQEVKDRVSHVEFIFCSQLFPHFQSKSMLFQRMLTKMTKAVEDEWKEKEAILLKQLDELSRKKQDVENQFQQLTCTFEETKTKLAAAERSANARLEDVHMKDEIISALKGELEQKTAETSNEKKFSLGLLKQISEKDRELSIEREKRLILIEKYEEVKASYKELKSQYSFLARNL